MALKHADSAPALAVDAASSWPGGPGGPGRSELMRRIGFTLGALIVFRVGTYLPIPGLDPAVLGEAYYSLNGDIFRVFSAGGPWSATSDFLRVVNVFSGGATERMAIFALSVVPYLSALMIMRLMAVVWPAIDGSKTAGEAGRNKFYRCLRFGTLGLAAAQSYALAMALESVLSPSTGSLAVVDPGFLFRAQTVIIIACGTMFLIWLGEQITKRGVGNGIALIIFAGIIGQLPSSLAGTFELIRMGSLTPWVPLFLLVITVGSAVLIGHIERAQRRIVVQHDRRQSGMGTSGGHSTRIPLKLNSAGMLPPIFAALLMPIPLAFVSFYEDSGSDWLQSVMRQFDHGQPLYLILYATLVVLFCFLCRQDAHNPTKLARNLERSGGTIAGIRPGRHTADHLAQVQTRLTAIGAVCLASICVLTGALFHGIAGVLTLSGAVLVVIVLITWDLIATIHWHYSMSRS